MFKSLQKFSKLETSVTMKIVVIGDSNFRDLFEGHGEKIKKNSGQDVTFEYATSVTSIKSLLAGFETSPPDVAFLASPTNEIALKSRNNTKSREGIVEGVLQEFFETVNSFAQKHEKVLLVSCFPLLRLDPPWLEGKFSFYKETMKKIHNSLCLANVQLGSDIEITPELLKPDRIHLNSDGLEILAVHLTNDIKIAEKEVNSTPNDETDDCMESPQTQSEYTTPPSRKLRSLRKTPARNKRQNEDTLDEVKSKRKRSNDGKIDTVLDKLDLFLREMREDRKANSQRFTHLETEIKETKTAQEEMKKEITALKEGDNCFSAAVREDIDAMDNLNARDTVVIKKLATDKQIPADKKELGALILETGKEILIEILGEDTGMKFIAPLYFSNAKRIQKEGARNELPPFKIVFKHLSDAIRFKDKAITASKEPSNRLYKSYISTQQNVGTRIRLMLMWAVVDVLKREKKEGWVSQSSAKPALMVKQAGSNVKTYSFIEAMTSYGEKIDQKVLDEASKLANRFYYGQTEKIFIVLKD